MNNAKLGVMVLCFVLIVSVVSIVAVNAMTGQLTRTRTIKGDISDKNGLPLYDDWEQSLSMVVAKDARGNIVGWGPLESQRDYTLSLRSGWSLPLYIYVGFYDPYRPDRGNQWPCTIVNEIHSWMDITCDQFDSGMSGAYR